MATVKPIILSYNLPKETDLLYKKLVKDGFRDIVVVDNGSDKCPPAKSANFLLPKNIRFTGQAKISLIYCMDYFPADYYWLITTSAVLLPNLNYQKKIQQAYKNLDKINLGVLSPALTNNKAIASQQYTAENLKRRYSICFHPEMVASLVSHKLLKICRERKQAYFEKNFVRGWGADYELYYAGFQNNLWSVIAHNIAIGWNNNIGYKKNLGGESLNTYFKKAGQEMEGVLRKKYGKEWYKKMFSLYLKKVNKIKFFYYIDKKPNRKL